MKPGSWNYVIITDYLSACQIIRDYFEAGKMWKGTECRIFAAGGRAYRLLVLLKKEEEKRKKEEPSGFSSSQKKKKKKKGRAYCRLLILSNPPAVQDCLCKASRMEQKINKLDFVLCSKNSRNLIVMLCIQSVSLGAVKEKVLSINNQTHACNSPLQHLKIWREMPPVGFSCLMLHLYEWQEDVQQNIATRNIKESSFFFK